MDAREWASQASLDSEFAALCTQCEQEWLSIYQIPYDVQHKYVGRGEKPRFKSRAVLPPASRGGVARPPFAASLRWTARHASNIVAYLKNNSTSGNNYALWYVAYYSARSLFFGASRYLVLNPPFSELTELQEWPKCSEVVGTMFRWGYGATVGAYGGASPGPLHPWWPRFFDLLHRVCSRAV